MILLVKMGDPRGPDRQWRQVLSFAVLAVGPWIVLFFVLTRR
jgi:hypothetical protein